LLLGLTIIPTEKEQTRLQLCVLWALEHLEHYEDAAGIGVGKARSGVELSPDVRREYAAT